MSAWTIGGNWKADGVTSASPSIAAFKGLLYMAWKGESDNRIFFNTNSQQTGWTKAQQVLCTNGAPLTSASPSLCVYNMCGEDTLFMVMKGTDASIWYATHNGTTWLKQQQVPGVWTSTSPSLAMFNGLLYMIWKGEGTDTRIWSSAYLPNGTWSAQQQVADFETDSTPSIAKFNDHGLWMVWKGATDKKIWYALNPLWHWSPQHQVPDVLTSAGPSLGVWNNTLYMFFRAADDANIYWARYSYSGDPPKGSGWIRMGQVWQSLSPSVLAASKQSDLNLFATSASTSFCSSLCVYGPWVPGGLLSMAWKGTDNTMWYNSYGPQT